MKTSIFFQKFFTKSELICSVSVGSNFAQSVPDAEIIYANASMPSFHNIQEI